jgi:hypothetical protein
METSPEIESSEWNATVNEWLSTREREAASEWDHEVRAWVTSRAN